MIRKKTSPRHHFFPDCIEYARHEYYNYVIGQFDNDRHSTCPVRLMTMEEVFLTATEAVFTDDYYAFKERMLKNGVQFPIQDDKVFTVVLSPEGYRRFTKRYLERPAVISWHLRDDGSVVMTFDCSQFQLMSYFVPFGDEIVDMEDLADICCK